MASPALVEKYGVVNHLSELTVWPSLGLGAPNIMITGNYHRY